MEGQHAQVIENSEGARTTPSVVAFTNLHGERLVPAAEVDVSNKRQHLVSNSSVWQSQRVLMVCQSAEELSSMVLTKMRKTAEQYLNKTISYV